MAAARSQRLRLLIGDAVVVGRAESGVGELSEIGDKLVRHCKSRRKPLREAAPDDRVRFRSR